MGSLDPSAEKTQSNPKSPQFSKPGAPLIPTGIVGLSVPIDKVLTSGSYLQYHLCLRGPSFWFGRSLRGIIEF